MSTIKYIPGSGPKTAQVMFIGEAPGAAEEVSGVAFSGRSGVILNGLMLSVGILRQDVYITNAVKVRPPGNRTPTTEEIASWMHVLKQEIQSVNPKVIVCLGKTASKAFELMDKSGIDQRILVFSTYHPSYLRRSKKATAEAHKHFKTIGELL